MIKHLIFVFCLLFSLFVLPSCTIFGGGSQEAEEGGTEEDYYPEEEAGEESSDISQEAGGEMEPAEENDTDGNVKYIDEEDEDFLEEDAVVMDESDESDESAESMYDSGEESADLSDSGQAGEGSSDFFDPATETTSSSGGTRVTPPAKKWISYKKIKSQPYNSAGFLINAVYIAREEDSMQSVSQKIFSSDQTNQLYAINPHLKVRAIKTGDKIYYPSPHRPQDSSQLLFYFEDKGIPPQYHQVQAGENIRAVASSLLGHKDSWKEIWATNLELESKGQLAQTRTIKYWSAGADSAPTEPEEPMEPAPDDSSAVGGEPESPNSPELSNSIESEHSEDDDDLLEDEGPTPQPPPSEGGQESRESDSSLNEEKNSESSMGGFSQTDIAIAGLLALSALILSVAVIKRKWKKKADFDYTAVNYEINE